MIKKINFLTHFISFLFVFAVFFNNSANFVVHAQFNDAGVGVHQRPATNNNDVFGTINAPAGVDKWNKSSDAGEGGIGLIPFLSAVLRMVTIIAGVWTMINFILAGWTYITADGDKSVGQKVSSKMINSGIGLVIIATSYTIAGLISLLVFGDPKFILEPTFQGIK